MPPLPVRRKVASADAGRVRDVCDHLRISYENYLNFCAEKGSDSEIRHIDAFMGVHNFHKLVVLDLLERQDLRGDDAKWFLKMARDTFETAMREEIDDRA